MLKRVFVFLLVVTMVLSASIPCFAATAFSDVDWNHWAYDYIRRMNFVEIISGYPDGTFKPERQVSKAEFIKMVAMALYPEYTVKEVANGEHWASQYVKELNNILIGENQYPDEQLDQVITRGEMADIIAAYHLLINKSTIKFDRSLSYISQMKDKDQIPEDSWGSVDHCIKYGIISGFEDSTFRFSDGLTRAQAAKVLSVAKYD